MLTVIFKVLFDLQRGRMLTASAVLGNIWLTPPVSCADPSASQAPLQTASSRAPCIWLEGGLELALGWLEGRNPLPSKWLVCIDVHHAYTIRSPSVQYPHTIRTRSVHNPYAIRIPYQYPMRRLAPGYSRACRTFIAPDLAGCKKTSGGERGLRIINFYDAMNCLTN